MRGREDQRGIDRFRLRNWRLRSKLAVVLLVPALSTATLAGLRLNTQLDDVELFGTVQRELAVSHQAAKVESALQVERDWAVQCVAAGRQNACPEHAARTGLTDNELVRYREAGSTTTALSAPLNEAFTKSLQSLDGLAALRVTLLSTKYPDIAVVGAYNQIIASLSQVHRAAISSLSEPAIVPLATAAQALYLAQEQLGQQNSILTSTALRKSFAPGAADELRAAQSRLDAAFTEFNDVASPANRQKFQDVVSGASVDGRNRLVKLALAQDGERKPVSITDAEVLKIGEDTANLVREVAIELENQANATTTRLAGQARSDAWRDAALVAISLLIAFGLMAMVAQSMLRPLRILRRSALDVARNQLPDAIRRIRSHRDPERAAEEAIVPVPLNTTEEVGQVARAFDLVQREAVRLAVEQVALRANVNDMFINLSRRSQALVERQISVIDRLEQDEQDPDHLASLFELDHLATQMRRNSENLLVLSGTTVNRRVTRPVAIAEVLGAAVSEVEKYARVQIAPTPDLMVQGRVVNDLAHLIAELLDNATAFSKPTTKVTVRTIETRKGEVAIRIHDRGVGMQEDDIVESNAKLAEPPEVDVSVAREMGLYVVGQLAKRHEIRVTLANNDDIEGGVTAQVILPITLLHKGAAPALPLPAAPVPSAAESTGVEGLAGVPKWTPEHPVVVPSQANAEENSGRHRIEQTSADGLFTARIEASEESGEDGYSYEPPIERPAEPATEIFPAISDDELEISHDALSRWFQTPAADVPAARSTTDTPAPQPDRTEEEDAEPATVNGLPKRQRSADTVKIEAPTAVPRAVADFAESDWGTADEGWRAAGALDKGAPAQTTENGLPKRVPKARLVPGSLPKPSSPAPQLATAAAIPGRSADRLRQRFATYQKGVQMGRESLFDSAVGGIPVIAEREHQ
ncbi:nitrate- and nitrite sensing domain-containing protein [Lentzea kentuckyensis]|uniref:nitrate- and nitrite sensing domain-containing protein n=1 Tax=Lentzea kentuckyensis TaxID=360086 RepID=UPI001FE5A840|nr:nitrate- and nitrite sensing domain-containing protein [Lentzea kentuckyensis]